MFRLLRFWARSRQPAFRPSPSLLRHNGQINVQRVRFRYPFFTTERQFELAVYTSFIATCLYRYIKYTSNEKKEQGDAKITAEKTEEDPAQDASEKFKKESGGWRENSSKEESGREGLGWEKSRSGAKRVSEDEADDAYEDEAENEDAEEDEDDDDDDNDDEEEEEEEDGEGEQGSIPKAIPQNHIFVPLGWYRERRSSFYKGSDADWQSFVEFARDKKRSLSVRNELAGLIGYYTASLRGFQKTLGMPINTRRYWLDVDFPERPPPEYERRGLEITRDYVALTSRPMSIDQYNRLRRILWPSSMATSLWASYRLLLTLQLARIKGFLNTKLEQENVNPKFSGSLIEFRRLENQKQESQPSPRLGGASPAGSGSATPTDATSKTSPRRALSNSTNALPPMPSLPEPGKDASIAFKKFRRTLAKTWGDQSLSAERGTFLISGLIEVEGSKAVCVLDVRAAYHPRESRWAGIAIAVRRLQHRKQAPKGGV